MFQSLITPLVNRPSRRSVVVAAASVAGAFGVLAMPGLVSAAEQPAAPPTVPPIIVNPTNPPIPTIPPIIVNPTNPPIPTIPPIIVNPTFPEPTNPDDLVNPTFPEPTNPDDLTNPEPDNGGDPEADPADPAVPVDPASQQVPTGQLPETGVNSGALAVLAVVLTAGGTAVVTLARRRPEHA